MAPRIEYDEDIKRMNQAQQMAPATLSGSVAAIVGNMVAATEGFDIRNPDDVKAARAAFEELMRPWFEAVLKAQATLGREKYPE